MAERDEVLGHEYDGIEEYDNDLPQWWVWIFVLTSVFGVCYFFWHHLGPGLDQWEELEVQMTELEQTRAAAATKKASEQEAAGPVDLLALVADEAIIGQGKEVFAAKCASCHGDLGQGLVGPNLTDEYWVHGGDVESIKRIIENGVVEKGMLAWKGLMADDDINGTVAYIWSIRGSEPPNPKKPEGEQVPHNVTVHTP